MTEKMKDRNVGGLEAQVQTPAQPEVDSLKAPSLSAAAVPPVEPTAPVAVDSETGSKRSTWNTKNLSLRLGADLVSAASAAVLVAPAISIIDRSIMENASGRHTLVASLKSSLRTLFLRPHHFLLSKPFALICVVYGGTYLTANTLDTAVSTTRALPPTHVTAGTAKFAAPSAANVGLSIYKDQVFVRLFGTTSPRPVTLPSYLLFAARDCMTIFASFNVPPLLGPVLSAHLQQQQQRWRYMPSGETIAQFTAPAAMQLASTPLHLLGLDLYNRPGDATTWRDRWAAVRKNWAVTAAARIARILPAFGVGGVVNAKVRRSLMERLE